MVMIVGRVPVRFSASQTMLQLVHCSGCHPGSWPTFQKRKLQSSAHIVGALPRTPAHPGLRISSRRAQQSAHVPCAVSLSASAPLSSPFVSSWLVWAALAFASAAGLWSEETKIGRELSGALVATLIGLILTNSGVIPGNAPQYDIVNKYLLPLAVPLLLFSADLRRVIRDTGNLLIGFLIGAFSTVVGTLVAYLVFPLNGMGLDGWKVAAALCARHIGGAVNFVGVGEVLELGASASMAALAADNVLCVVYFSTLYALAKGIGPEKTQSEGVSIPADMASKQDNIILKGCTGLALSASICFAGVYLSHLIGIKGAAIPAITAITVLLATLFPKPLSTLVPASESLATILMQFFFASIGASGSLKAVVTQAPVLFCFCLTQIAVHLGLILGIGKLVGLSRKDLLIASNANVGGPTTAAGMCATKKWKNSVVPALLIGTLGYSIATFIAIGLGYGVLRKM
ncbi:hypothetical protein BSKO_13104 [Bryopsis sp. KO-2023]|nr:hypothetical protein BSKO_13104 [Bryopsis sp. KO-2023]